MQNNKTVIRYANCWEDTGILLKALRIRPGETGLSVASGGDNTFALLLSNPKKIYAIDRNPAQLRLCELKAAAMRLLSYEDVLRFFGVCSGDRAALYARVREALSEAARGFFDKHPEIIREGILNSGKFERFFGIFRRRIIPLFTTRKTFAKFAAMDDSEQQLAFFREKIDRFRLHAMFRIYFGYRVMGRLGRDRSCYDYVDEKEQSGDDLRQRFAFGISHTSNARNPYMQYIVNGGFSPRALPLYLHRSCFPLIRARLDRITFLHSDLLHLQTEPLDFANLSDIFEYMSEAEFAGNAAALSEMMKPSGRAAYWNMQNRRYLPEAAFTCDRGTSAALFAQNRSWFYRDFLLYRRN
ncbi:MAG: DUF3419 family protein [Oscillospiraceae bacterium]|nr:DUF3419 family protein [Oscillospiraceae bacterium]